MDPVFARIIPYPSVDAANMALGHISQKQYLHKIPLESLYSCPGIKTLAIIFPSVVILPLNPSLQIFFFPSLNCLFLSPFSESPIVFFYNYHNGLVLHQFLPGFKLKQPHTLKKKKNLPNSLNFYYQILSHAGSGFYPETIK